MGFAATLQDLESRLHVVAASETRISWPSNKYENDPIGFCRDILDFEPWEHPEPNVSQADAIRAACRPDSRVSWVSCHKAGKSRTLAAIPLIKFATRKRIRSFLFAPKIEHIEKIAVWPEMKQLYLNSGRCKECRAKEHRGCNHARGIWECEPQPACAYCSPIGEASWWNDDPTCGLVSPDGRREIKAWTATSLDALGGISGQEIQFIFDEAGGIKGKVFHAMHGNSAGGASWLMAGNPLHNEGEQYDAHHSQKHKWVTIETSAEHSPNVRAGEKVTPGLATLEWMKDRAEAWGADSPLYQIRVLGKYPKYAKGQILRVDEITAAEERWYRNEFSGRLQIGVDVAFTGDDAVIAPRRGYKISHLERVNNTTPDGLALRVATVARELRLPHERKPMVAYDAEGKAGVDFGEAIRHFEDELDIYPIRSGGPAKDQRSYGDKRTELAHGFAGFVRRGGAIPTDDKLEGEISWMVTRPKSKDDERPVLPSNDEFRKAKGRSPDSFDACKFACAWLEDGDKLGDPKRTDAKEVQSDGTSPEAPADLPPADSRVQPRQVAHDEFDGPFDASSAADLFAQIAWGHE
jgi:hypothetical protein